MTLKRVFAIFPVSESNAIPRSPKDNAVFFEFNDMDKVSRNIHTFLEKWIEKSLKQYVSKMDGGQNGHLHDLVIGGVEKPLVRMVLRETQGNQTHAANILGINRTTLRKKIQDYKIKCKERA